MRNRCHQRLPRLCRERCEAAHFVKDCTQAQLGVEDVVVASIDPASLEVGSLHRAATYQAAEGFGARAALAYVGWKPRKPSARSVAIVPADPSITKGRKFAIGFIGFSVWKTKRSIAAADSMDVSNVTPKRVPRHSACGDLNSMKPVLTPGTKLAGSIVVSALP